VEVGLISNSRKTAYMKEVEALSAWCKDNNLDLNISKTKEMVVDWNHHTPLRIYDI